LFRARYFSKILFEDSFIWLNEAAFYTDFDAMLFIKFKSLWAN